MEGNFSDGILHVQGVAMPPPESSHLSRYDRSILYVVFNCTLKDISKI